MRSLDVGCRRVDPIAVFAYQFYEFVHGIRSGNVSLYDLLLLVQGYFVVSGTHVTVVGVGHFARTVDDASHDADLNAFEVRSSGADHGRGFLKVEKRAAARGTGDVLRFADAGPRSLQNAERQGGEFTGRHEIGYDTDTVAETVDHERPEVGGGRETKAILVFFGGVTRGFHGRCVGVVSQEDQRNRTISVGELDARPAHGSHGV